MARRQLAVGIALALGAWQIGGAAEASDIFAQSALIDAPAPPGSDFPERLGLLGPAGADVIDPAAADSAVIRPANLQEEPRQPILRPRPELVPETPLPPAAAELGGRLFGPGGVEVSTLARRRFGIGAPPVDIVFGVEAKRRVTTDAGSLLGTAPTVLGVGVQRRTPIVNDPRVRGSRVGQLAASGSYWVPARIDLDTILSKIDSRIVRDVIVFKGPYSVLYGPGLEHVDVQLLGSPRLEGGFQVHGSSGFDFKTNGQQWYGRQTVWGGNEVWGFRAGYGHGTGNDYRTGNGTDVPASYNSRDLDVALGADLPDDRQVELNLLRLDQTGVEYPGQAFDMDYLVADAYDLRYSIENRTLFDRLDFDVWYNRTRFDGNAQQFGKRRQFPFLDFLRYEGFTDVDSMSTGTRLATTWEDQRGGALTVGVDLRYVKQELNEISSGRFGLTVFENANSPIPRSEWNNPGIFVCKAVPVTDRLTLTGGARVDWLTTGVVEDPQKLQALGVQQPQSSLAEILGTDEFDQGFALWAAYLTARYELTRHWQLLAAAGHGERPPSLTELYAAQPFMFVLQNGLNTVTGDPTLRPERAWQIDLGLAWRYCRFRGGVNGFHAWILDRITFENTGVVRGPPAGQIEQVNLQYVNTDLATLAGVELYAEYDLSAALTPFATLSYVDARDRDRTGDFATRPVSPGSPKRKVPGLPRGYFSGIPGAAEEPLPGILPLESRLGIRLHQPCPRPQWWIELSARVVDDQDRVATSLVELPTPGFGVWDLRGVWQVSDRLMCVAGVENFTDRNYREHLDFHSPSGIQVFQPGVNFYFGSELVY